MEGQLKTPGLGERLSCLVGDATLRKSIKFAYEKAEQNRPYFGKTVEILTSLPRKGEAAIVVTGGPSLHRKKSLQRIKSSGFKGGIITCDGSLAACLRAGIVPDCMVSVDSHPYRIVRWLGDPNLATRPTDDYFLCQDLDPEHWKDEVRCNEENFNLVNRYGRYIKAALATSVDTSVTKRCVESGMGVYWWNPLYDDYENPESITRRVFDSNGIPCMATGGNVGASAWVLTHSVLGYKHIALVGMDLGYAPGTPYRNTQYYNELLELFGDRIKEAYIEVYNPYLEETWLTDPTYNWYRKIFIEMAAETDCQTYNCTEGGTLFDQHVPFIALDEFLKEFGNA